MKLPDKFSVMFEKKDLDNWTAVATSYKDGEPEEVGSVDGTIMPTPRMAFEGILAILQHDPEEQKEEPDAEVG